MPEAVPLSVPEVSNPRLGPWQVHASIHLPKKCFERVPVLAVCCRYFKLKENNNDLSNRKTIQNIDIGRSRDSSCAHTRAHLLTHCAGPGDPAANQRVGARL